VEIWPFRACAMRNMQYNKGSRNTMATGSLLTGEVEMWPFRACAVEKYAI